MFEKMIKMCSAALCCGIGVGTAGCACGTAENPCVKTVQTTTYKSPCADPGELTALPPNAKPGECWAKVYVPPTFRTVSERVLVRPASERLEVVPAEYEWVEERVMIKDASRELHVVPAEFAARERTIEVEPARRDWEITKSEDCVLPEGRVAKDVFCLVDRPPIKKTITEECMVKPATVQEKVIPAEYETVRRQRLVRAATTERIPIPAEYATVEKQVKVCDARMAWQRVACEEPGSAMTHDVRIGHDGTPMTMLEDDIEIESPDRINAVKGALQARGYSTGPMNGEIRARDWVAINKFQKDNNLPVGDLNPQTLRVLGV